jgi:fructose-bisphosphate aldolase class II
MPFDTHHSTDTRDLMLQAWRSRLTIPAFNIPYLPMMEPVVSALRDTGSFGLIAVARLEWTKFASGSLAAFFEEYQRVKDERFTRLHLDHVPVIDEDQRRVPYLAIMRQAITLGFGSVMVDGSRLPLEENIAATAKVVALAHAAQIPVEAELGAVLGHEAGPLPPYEELFASGRGFTDPDEARRFVQETGVDWLSVAIGNIHGAIAGAARTAHKPEARLDLVHLRRIADATQIPLVLHGGSGIQQACILAGVKQGIAKINIGTTLRQAYEAARTNSIATAQQAVYRAAVALLTDELQVAGSAAVIHPTVKKEIA